jgi:hypothetical protein
VNFEDKMNPEFKVLKESKIKVEKQKLREEIWKLLEEKKVARFPLPCFRRIPNFEETLITKAKKSNKKL